MIVTDPMGYLEFLGLVADSAGVLTDSGGIQEETTFLGVPCFTLRDTTERPITCSQGTNTLLGLAPERIHFGGYLRGPGLVEAYRALDVGVWLREGNDGGCRGVLEAMACGVPVIAGSEGAPAELVRDGQEGRVVDAGDAARIAGAIAQLLGDPAGLRRMGIAARSRAEEFTPARAAEETLAFWQTLRGLPRIS